MKNALISFLESGPMNSMELADKIGRPHAQVRRDLDTMIRALSVELKEQLGITESTYKDASNRVQRMYVLSEAAALWAALWAASKWDEVLRAQMLSAFEQE